MCSPLISIVIPVFNAESTILECLNSVSRQTYHEFECFIVDDCSTDKSPLIVKNFCGLDNRFKFFSTAKNSGSPSIPRNYGISISKGKYIAFLDSDDLWEPNKLKLQIEALDQTGGSICCTSYNTINALGDIIGRRVVSSSVDYQSLLRLNEIGCSTVMVKSDVLHKYDFPICGHEDYALWLLLSRKGFVICSLKECLVRYRVGSKSISSNKFKVLPYFVNIYHSREGFSYFVSCIYTFRYVLNVILRRFIK